MTSRKHIYYITISDIQNVAKEILGRNLDNEEFLRVTDRLLDKIQWYDPLEALILSEGKSSHY